MATAAAIEDAITCCICFNVYRDPHALPCLHTLCKPCIDRLAVRGKLECPECRETSEIRKIRKDFKTQSLIDAHNGKAGGSCNEGSGIREVCGMCRNPGKVVHSHCKECDHFMCAGCEQTHNVMKVCRGHTVKAVKDILRMAKSKLEYCVNQWKREKNNIAAKTSKFETTVESVQEEAEKQIELTNKHFDKLINDLEKKRSTLVNKIREANKVAAENLKKNKGCFCQIISEIQINIDMLQEVINGKHMSTMNNMVVDMDESLKEQVIDIRKRVDKLDEQAVLPVKLQIDKNICGIDTGIRLKRMLQPDLGTGERPIMLYSDYSKLKTNQYQLSNSQDCNTRISGICIIKNNIWCAAYGDGIQIYNKDMKLIKKIKHKNYSFVNGLTEWRGDVIVACSDGRGLHQITRFGDYVQQITGTSYADVSSNEKYVYGLRFAHRIVVIFICENKKWSKFGQITSKNCNRDFRDKLFVNERSLFISLWEENCIQKYSLEGELQQTFGRGETLTGDLNCPILSGLDMYENLLVVDVKNKQLKVSYSEEQAFHVVSLKFGSEQPFSAVMDGNDIWVVSETVPSKMLKFSVKV